MRFTTLDQWLQWQEQLHPTQIDLGLERFCRVCDRLEISSKLPCKTVIVGGTNGKGSTVSLMESILLAGGYDVVCYTSPHLLRYNERIRINGNEVEDERLLQAFERIDKARGQQSLTYFEFGTLAALVTISDLKPDVAILEVGLGGRLDAVNAVEPDVSVITSIGIDHTDWLGETREQIALEKIAIGRAHRPMICAEPDPPQNFIEKARETGITLFREGVDYGLCRDSGSWRWWFRKNQRSLSDVPISEMKGEHQVRNTAAAITALSLLECCELNDEVIRRGVATSDIVGRFQVMPEPVMVILDVAHNPEAIGYLAEGLRMMNIPGRTVALFGMMKRKDLSSAIETVCAQIDRWVVPDLMREDMYPHQQVADRILLVDEHADIDHGETFGDSVRSIQTRLKAGDCVVVFGSFALVEAYLKQ